MSEEYPDPVRELEDQMRAADALIESLEGEVLELRRDLERAGEALRAAQEEVASRGRTLAELEESERARAAVEEGARALRAELNELRQQSADEQLRLRNRHTADIASLREELAKRSDAAPAEPEGKISALREEFRKERTALEERHQAEVEDLKRAAEQWEEQLRDGYQDLEERRKTEIEDLRRNRAEEVEALVEEHRAEIEALEREHRTEIESLQGAHREEVETLLQEAESEKIDLERTLREEFGREHEREFHAEHARHAAELQALRSAAASRELDLERQLDSEVEMRRVEAEAHRGEVERLGLDLDSALAAAEERRQEDLKEVKRLAEARERELRKAQAARLAEEKEAAERRVATLKAQREADNSSARERHAGELTKVQRELEDHLAAEEEFRRSQVAALEERLEGVWARRSSEARLYGERLKELERNKVAQRKAAEEELKRRLAEDEEEKDRLKDRIAELEDALEESGTMEAELREALAEIRAHDGARDSTPDGTRDEDRRREAEEAPPPASDLEGRLEEADAARQAAEKRAAELEARLREAEQESQRNARELEEAQKSLRQASDPERRLRSGISLFNASEHTRTVASISKALGLPKVHIGPDAGPSSPPKPVITFIWSEMAWRRYVSDPTEGVEEPRVYLVGSGDDPQDILRRPGGLEPNARMNARGHLILGVQAY